MYLEPLMFFYTFSYMFIYIIENDFYIKKSCLINLNYNNTICENLNLYNNEKIKVQLVVSNFLKYKNFIDKLFPIFIAYFLANKLNKKNQTIGMIIGFIGKIFYGIIILLNVYFFNLKLEICYLAILPLILTGGDIIITSSIFSIVKSITLDKDIKFKNSLIQAFYFMSMPIGTYISKKIFFTYLKDNNLKFEYMFLMYIIILIICTSYSLYIHFMLQKKFIFINTNIEKKTFLENIKKTLKTLNIINGFKNIKNNNIKLLFICTMLYSFQKEEKTYIYLYTHKTFEWGGNEFSNFKTIQYIIMFFTLVLGLPLVMKFTNIAETKIIFASTISGFIGKIFYYFSFKPSILYIGLFAGFLNPCSSTMIKSLVLKLSDENNVSIIFVFFNIFDILCMSFSNIFYSTIYNLTIENKFSGIFLLSAFSQKMLFILNSYLMFYKKI